MYHEPGAASLNKLEQGSIRIEQIRRGEAMTEKFSTMNRPTPSHRQRGVTSIEYALIGSLIAVAIVVSVTALGGNLSTLYDNVANEVSQAAGN
jgi:pilus assembly protein Flp/PilA